MALKKWKIPTADPAAVEKLVRQLELPLPMARILVLRGFEDPVIAEEFLNPRLADLTDPFSLPCMTKAANRIWTAINGGETIVVFGDYDVDGVTSTALLVRLLSALGGRVYAFVPDRLDEGYGLSPDAIERCIAEHNPRLIVTVDCGTNSVDSVGDAQRQGVDVIVTDHHEPDEQTAPAFALINPKLGHCGENLCGAGVAFKLAHALIKTGREQGHALAALLDLRRYLDIVALGTVADIVPLVGENRIIVRHGLAQLEASCWAGMTALKEVASVSGELNTGHLGFQLGPRINAAGRIGEPMQAVRLLTTDDMPEARNIAKLLDRNNRDRRDIERKISDDAFAEIDHYFDPSRHFGLVVAGEGWHPGVVGIVASRVSRHYNRPAIVMGIEEDGSARGSCRGIEEFDMLAGLQSCEGHLNKFGGHKMAAGLEIKPGSLDAFKKEFNEAAARLLQGVDLSATQHVDAIIDFGDLGWPFYEALRNLRPFGQDNPEPVWALQRVQVKGLPRVVGQKHLKFTIASGNHSFDAIAFNYPVEALPAGEIDIAFTLQENNWNGNTTLQLQIQDIRASKK